MTGMFPRMSVFFFPKNKIFYNVDTMMTEEEKRNKADECGKRYLDLLKKTREEIRSIDHDTPYIGDTPPSWWLSMDNLETIIIKKIAERDS